MNHSYNTISLEEAGSISVLQLIEMYNDAIETIWYLQERLNETLCKPGKSICLSFLHKSHFAFLKILLYESGFRNSIILRLYWSKI